MTWLDFFVLMLAASAVVDVWFNGSLFADLRALMQDIAGTDGGDGPIVPVIAPGEDASTDEDDPASGSTGLPILLGLADRLTPKFVAEILSCDFCFSYHAPWIVGMVFFLPALWVTTPWLVFLLKLPAYALAATRLGNLINAVAPDQAKYNRL